MSTTPRQKATLTTKHSSNAKNYSGQKELVSYWEVAVYRKGELTFPINVRCWMGRSHSASVVHASIWANDRDTYLAGSGKAGGYGYHKESAAIDAAFRSAGIELAQSISGVGDTAIREALEALARALGYRKFAIVNRGS